MSDEPRTLVIIVRRDTNGEGRCRRCGHPVLIDAPTMRAIVMGAAMLCKECALDLYRQGRTFDPAEIQAPGETD